MISKVFKMIFNHVQSFYRKRLFDLPFKKISVVEISLLTVTKLNKINTKKKAKSISTFEFTTLYTTIPHKLLIKVLPEVINFVIKWNTRSRIDFSKISLYWTSKGCGKRYFRRQTLIDAISFLVTKCYFNKQEIGIPMGTDPAPYWANLFLYLYFFGSKYIQQLISKGSLRVYKFHGTFRFIDDLCTIMMMTSFLHHKNISTPSN